MLLTIRTTTTPVADLSYLLHKHPGKIQEFKLSFGMAQVFYPEVREEACQVALSVTVDPIGLVRSARGENFSGAQYVNDRPYVASSFFSVALAEVFGSALGGRCKERPEAVDKVLDLEAEISVVSCRQGEDLLQRLFAPLGYEVQTEPIPLDAHFAEWGDSRYFVLKLHGRQTLRRLLSHLYVLLPVLDNQKHYWIGNDEVEKLLSRGKDWLPAHPEKELITQRYLRYQRALVYSAMDRLVPEESELPEEGGDSPGDERQANLHEQRLGAVLGALKASGAARVLDLGCGEGRLLKMLLAEPQFREIVGMDVSFRALEIARKRLRYEGFAEAKKARLSFLHGSLIYRDVRLAGFDAAALVEVIEHLDPPRLRAFERVLFEFARPQTIVLTTPNRDYNSKWASLPGGEFRHTDHRFEWSRQEFQDWAQAIAGKFSYRVRFLPVGPEDAEVGAPSQMGIFERAEDVKS